MDHHIVEILPHPQTRTEQDSDNYRLLRGVPISYDGFGQWSLGTPVEGGPVVKNSILARLGKGVLEFEFVEVAKEWRMKTQIGYFH